MVFPSIHYNQIHSNAFQSITVSYHSPHSALHDTNPSNYNDSNTIFITFPPLDYWLLTLGFVFLYTIHTSEESLRRLRALARASLRVRPGCTGTVVRCLLGRCARTTDRSGDCGVDRVTSSHTPLLPVCMVKTLSLWSSMSVSILIILVLVIHEATFHYKKFMKFNLHFSHAFADNKCYFPLLECSTGLPDAR